MKLNKKAGCNVCSSPSTFHCWCWLPSVWRPARASLCQKLGLEAHQVTTFIPYIYNPFSRLTRVEDAFLTGYCARALGNVEKVHSPKFSCGQLVAQDCDMATQLTGHKVEF